MHGSVVAISLFYQQPNKIIILLSRCTLFFIQISFNSNNLFFMHTKPHQPSPENGMVPLYQPWFPCWPDQIQGLIQMNAL